MSVREFDGSDDKIILDNGVVTDIAAGARSYVALGKGFNIGASGKAILSVVIGAGGGVDSLYHTDDGLFRGGDVGGDQGNNAMNLTNADWQVIGMNMAAPTATPRFHRKVLGSGSWTHGDAAGSVTTSSQVADGFIVATFERTGTFGYTAMRVAMIAAWQDVNLTDTDFVNIESNHTTVFVDSLSPSALWDFNQASVADDVLDLTGGGANETSITGTTVIGGDDPAWTFGLESPWDPEVDADELIRTVASPLRPS